MVASWARHGWPSTLESSGGPTYFSGTQAYGVDAGTIQRAILAYIAAGSLGIGQWCWNARLLGQEGGEYALTTLSGAVGARAKAAGRVAALVQQYRFELWNASNSPKVPPQAGEKGHRAVAA
jgi:hypothetical protein